jgi:hypothetical protein
MGAGLIASARRRAAAVPALTGALMQVPDNTSVAMTNGADVSYSQLKYDDHGWKTSNTTLTTPSSLPAGTLMRLFSAFYTGSTGCFATHFKGGAGFNGSGGSSCPSTGGGNQGSIWGAIIPAVAGEAFTTRWANVNSSTQSDQGRNWFGVEILPPGMRYTFAQLPSTFTLSSADGNKQIGWTHSIDTMGAHSNSSNTHLFVAPSDTTGKVRITASMRTNNGVTTAGVSMHVWKNGIFYGAIERADHTSSGAFAFTRIVSPIIDVVPGDTVEVRISISAGSGWSFPVSSANWVCFEELPATWKYCRVGLTANKTLAAGDNAVTWDAAQYDPLGCWSAAAPTQITVPSGFTRARVSHAYDANFGGSDQLSWFVKNNISKLTGGGNNTENANNTSRSCGFGVWVDVVPGDFIVEHIDPTGGGTLLANDRTWFQVEFQ